MVKGRKKERRNVHPKKVLMSIEQKSVLKAKGAVRHFVAVNNVNISTTFSTHTSQFITFNNQDRYKNNTACAAINYTTTLLQSSAWHLVVSDK